MSIEKSEIKKLTARELGLTLDQQKTAAQSEVHRLEGAKGALLQAATALNSVINVWKKDLDDEKVTKDVADAVIRAVTQCQGSMRSLAEKADVQKLIKQGELVAFEKALDTCEKLFNTEDAKSKALAQAIQNGAMVPEEEGVPVVGRPALRVVGQRPGMSIAQQRRAEQQAAETAPQEAPAAQGEAQTTSPASEAQATPNPPSEGQQDAQAETPPVEKRKKPARTAVKDARRAQDT